jgi:5'(3')-deoxyribonucleotidase
VLRCGTPFRHQRPAATPGERQPRGKETHRHDEFDAVIDDAPFVLGVDLDGVCMDYYGAMKPYAAAWMGRSPETLPDDVSYGFKEWEIDKFGGYDSLHQYLLDNRFFVDAPPMADAPEALRRLSNENVRIRIITHRLWIKGAHQEAASQTVEWLDKNDIPYWDLCFVRDKPVVGADLYIEDTSKNIIALREAGRPTIIFTNLGNVTLPGRRVSDWIEVERIVRDEHKRWSTNRDAEAGLLALGRAE